MSRKDRLTGKVSRTGNSRSKALNITKKAWHFNIQTVTLTDKNGKKIKLKTSAKNIRTFRNKGLFK
ncbi:50S ribosomal protein L28 [Mycoplasma haemocanis str. Illinois]|uniref:Large ribosomal subunit protein bL28 n=1 Tax=Mycoplasma haemocanis (strain Illinois) TaxID=1111676 RepID=H6N5L2_MYCHN|nr:50S ribosomal protein L28 [Mycoplasma haemocanis]AEW44972.1 50S ribosomal protein L28 [Mycoplasma haemocanis str. Illinois]